MITWTPEDKIEFINCISSFWPGGWAADNQISDKSKTWLAAASGVHFDIAKQAITDLYQYSNSGKLPPIPAFREACRTLDGFCKSRAKAKYTISESRTYTAQEIAADDPFWEDRFDNCRAEKQLEWERTMRKKLAAGVSILGLLGADGA